ncbi:hypothetical protein SAMN02927900_00982 [Rhizobium mongolense subsp. loessense]|uniref:Uncharacterized protein n=1 Tax=Rhizobium mongolense subsp. loessense TaxID=158890 RepID=A0A1G4PUU2_9HYPH|nr:hypothetical protein [Rhizobium mongolense]SCW35858.1 hypothetical protein SAMN02927900_00982 [Rhizobium mongolense subsp. loessense]
MSSDISYMPYDRRAETDGTWTVVDAITGHPARIGYKQLNDLTGKDASEFMDILNRNKGGSPWRRLPRYAIQGLPDQISGIDHDQA